MKVSEITNLDLAKYCRIDEPDEDDLKLLDVALAAAKSYVCGYTGLTEAQLDEHDDIVIAVYVLCEDMYDNRALVVDKDTLNPTVVTILSLHSVNLI